VDDELRKKAEEEFDLSYKDEIELWLAWGVVKRKVVPKVKVWLARFWNDPAYFTAMCRAGVVAFSAAITNGIIVFPVGSKIAWYASVFTTAAALLFPAGQTNRTPEEIKGIAQDPSVTSVVPPTKLP
jgi:hypothetical protein